MFGWTFGFGVAGSIVLAALLLAGIVGCGQPAVATSRHTDGLPLTTSTHRTVPSGTARSQTTPVPLPGVIADCTAPPPAAEKATVRPVSITLACADDGLGVEDLHWTMWTASVAVGTGRVWPFSLPGARFPQTGELSTPSSRPLSLSYCY